MTRSVRVAAMQLRARDRIEFSRSLESTLVSLHGVCRSADLVVLPEGTFPAYVLGKQPLDEAATADTVERLSDLARSTNTVIVAGIALPRGGVVYNSAIVIDADGSLAGRADKLFLWHFDRHWFAQGKRLAPVRTSVGTLGVLICADGRLPTIARSLVDHGAEVLIMPTAWVTSGRDPSALENVQADLLARVRAYENRAPFVAANKCGAELGMVAYCGKSQIVDACGEVVAIAGEHRPARAPLARPAPRVNRLERSLRIAISFDPLPSDIDERLEMLDDEYAIALHDDERLGMLDREIPIASVEDSVA